MSKRPSINPFDDDSDADHDEENPSSPHPPQRSAPLDFAHPFDDGEDPALTFDKTKKWMTDSAGEGRLFLSPLKTALHDVQVEEQQHLASNHHQDEEDTDEASPLLAPEDYMQEPSHSPKHRYPRSSPRQRGSKGIPKEIHTGGDESTVHHHHHHHKHVHEEKRSRASALQNNNKASSVVMTELATGDISLDVMDFKYILLEDLGTASSWIVLLLPYLAFGISMFLEYATHLSTSTLGPIQGAQLCDMESIFEVMHRVPSSSEMSSQSRPCHASFSMKGLFGGGNDNGVWSGSAFDSGKFGSMPVIGTSLNGDAFFPNLSFDGLAMIAQGKVRSSVVILEHVSLPQSITNNGTLSDGGWIWQPIFVSPFSAVSVTCVRSESSQDDNDPLFDCKTPGLVTLAFSMPRAAIYRGGTLRMFVLYEQIGNATDVVDESSMNRETQTTTKLIVRNATITATTATSHTNYSNKEMNNDFQSWLTAAVDKTILNPALVLEEIVSTSKYTLQYRSKTTVRMDTVMRTLSFMFTFGFLIFWCRKLGLRCCSFWKSIFFCCREERIQSSTEKYWWENPWVLFPERYYIVILLMALLLVQEPFLVILYFFPHLRSSTLHMVADSAIGIGVQGILLVYSCLFEGLKYHTAERSKRRAEKQRKALELRRAVKLTHVNDQSGILGSPAAVDDFYREFGDVDGSTFTSHLRLPSDPLGDGWIDFFLPKLALWFVGIFCVTISAYCRFLPDKERGANSFSATHVGYSSIDMIYMSCSVIQVFTIVLWIYFIVAAMAFTGEELNRQPFLATRPAQLAYRVLFAHTALAITALLAAFLLYIENLQNAWHSETIEVSLEQREKSFFGLILGAIENVISQFPYSGTATTVGFGRLLCVTVEGIITAFIFLPAHTLDADCEEEEDHTHHTTELRNYFKNKREKRLVVHMAKESKTWRIFPCPIQKADIVNSQLQDHMYQLYKDLHTDRNLTGRGIVSIGPYTPVFCNEIACYLNEAAWQSYYTPPGSEHFVEKDDFIGWMNLEALGLQLEGYVFDDRTNAQALVATNIAPQVDGEEDSIIVVAFRGTSNVAHMQIDLRMRQVPLLDQIAGTGDSAIKIFPDHVYIDDKDGWLWNTHADIDKKAEHVKCVACWTEQPPPTPMKSPNHLREQSGASAFEDGFAQGAKGILKVTPVAKNTFPMVHEGFQDAYVQIRKQIFDLLIPVLQRQMAKAADAPLSTLSTSEQPLTLPKIYCTGHSLGGSLAQIFALDLASNCELGLTSKAQWMPDITPTSYQKNEPGYVFFSPSAMENDHNVAKVRHLQPPIAVYTFGQPRVGNKPFARLYKQRIPHTFRVVNEGDAITAIPNYLCCRGLYKHAGLEVVLDQGKTGNILVGPTVVETIFRFHKVRASVAAHQLERYRDCLECAFDPAQLQDYYRGHNVAYQELMVTKSKLETQNSVCDDKAREQRSLSVKYSTAEIPEWMIAPRTTTTK